MLPDAVVPPVQQTSEYPTTMVQSPSDGDVSVPATTSGNTQYISQWPPTGSGILDIPDSLM